MSSGAMSSGKNGSSELLPDEPAGDVAQDTLSESSDVDDGEECAADARQGEGSRRGSPQPAATIDVSDALTEDDTGGGQAAGDEELATRDDSTDERVEIQRKVKHCHVSDLGHSDSLHQTGSASQSEAGVRWQKPVPEASGGDYAVEVNGPPAANGSRVETYKGFVKGRISIGGNGRSGQLRQIQARHAIQPPVESAPGRPRNVPGPSPDRQYNAFPARYRTRVPIRNVGPVGTAMRHVISAPLTLREEYIFGGRPTIANHFDNLFDFKVPGKGGDEAGEGRNLTLRKCMESRPPLPRDLSGPTPCTYSPRLSPPHHSQAPAYTMGRRPTPKSPDSNTTDGRSAASQALSVGSRVAENQKAATPARRPATGHPGVRRKRPSEANTARPPGHGGDPRSQSAPGGVSQPGRQMLPDDWQSQRPHMVKTQRKEFPGPGTYNPWHGAVTRSAPQVSLYRRPVSRSAYLDSRPTAPPPNLYRPLTDYVRRRGPCYTMSELPRCTPGTPNRTL